jgi:hypothetical protein
LYNEAGFSFISMFITKMISLYKVERYENCSIRMGKASEVFGKIEVVLLAVEDERG